MSIRIPQNQIQFKYTIGNEYIYQSNYKEYQGHYYELNNNTFAGKEFSINAPILIKKNSDKVDSFLLTNPEALNYQKLSKINLNNFKIVSLPVGGNEPEADNVTSFYCKKKNDNIIKKIDEDTYISLQTNSLYQTTYIGFYNNVLQTVEEAEKQIIGISEWANSDIIGDL